MTEIKKEYVHTTKYYQAKCLCTVKQYQKSGFGCTCDFVDIYLNGRLKESMALDRALSHEELESLLNVYIARSEKGDNVDFCDPTEQQMNTVFVRAEHNLANLEELLLQKIPKENFDLHYEKRCYFLVWNEKGLGREVAETFHISKQCHPLACLKMAHLMGKKLGVKCNILLSDNATKVDRALLAFAISEV